MYNVSTGTLVAHDVASGASWIAWNGVRVRVPFVHGIKVGAAVQWAIASDEIRLPARSAKPLRPTDTAFNARVLAIRSSGAEAEIDVAASGSVGPSLVLTASSDIVARKGIGVGDQLVLRLRGEHIEIAAAAPLSFTSAGLPASPADASPSNTRLLLALLGGGVIGLLGGLIGLGGAEFRLPLLIGAFGFAALPAVIMNKAMSLVVVAAALLFRTGAVPTDAVLAQWPIVINLLAGSLLGAWLGAGWATRMRGRTLYRVIAILLLVIAAVLIVGHDATTSIGARIGGLPLWVAGAAAGLAIGVVASLLGVAGGELLIPTLVLLFGVDIKLAGSLSLVVSLPTMVVGFFRYSRDESFAVVAENRIFLITMAVGSIGGAWLGGLLLGFVPATLLLPLLAAILIVSAAKVWRHA